MNQCRKIILLSILGCLILLPAIGFAESRIYLKDGRIIKVDRFWREEGIVKYESFGGIIGIPLEDVKQIITPEMEAFEETRKVDTVRGYEAFTRKFPRGELTEQAKKRIRELQFDEVKQINSAQVYLDYMRRNPNSIYLQEAKERAEVLIFQEAARRGGVDKYKEYLEIYPDGKYAEASGKALDHLDYENVKRSNAIPQIEAFLAAHPESPYQQELEEQIAQLKSQAEVRAKAKKEQDLKAKERQMLEAQQKKTLWTRILSGVGVLVVLVIAGLLVLRKKRLAAQAALAASAEEVLASERIAMPSKEAGPIRYEDLIGAPRKDDNLSLPELEGVSAWDKNKPMSLPEPEKKMDDSGDHVSEFITDDLEKQEDVSFAENDESVIAMGFDGGGGSISSAADSEKEIDLSDHDTEFKLELEDVPDESEDISNECEQGIEDKTLDKKMDLSGGDLPNMFDDDEIKKRRGGGSQG